MRMNTLNSRDTTHMTVVTMPTITQTIPAVLVPEVLAHIEQMKLGKVEALACWMLFFPVPALQKIDSLMT